MLALLDRDAHYNTHPLRQPIDAWLTDDVVRQVAAEHAKGRRLLVATVNIEAGRPVIWDMGAIASSQDPGAPELFRTVLLASASIPGVFERQYIIVDAGGKRYEEIHVDGGTVTQVFVYGVGVDLNTIAQRAGVRGPKPHVRLFILRNGRLYPEYEHVVPLCEPIAKRAVSSLIISQGVADVLRLYVQAQQEGIDYNVASITPDFRQRPPRPFDPGYMRAVFEYGYDRLRAGTIWAGRPPFFGSSPRAVAR